MKSLLLTCSLILSIAFISSCKKEEPTPIDYREKLTGNYTFEIDWNSWRYGCSPSSGTDQATGKVRLCTPQDSTLYTYWNKTVDSTVVIEIEGKSPFYCQIDAAGDFEDWGSVNGRFVGKDSVIYDYPDAGNSIGQGTNYVVKGKKM